MHATLRVLCGRHAQVSMIQAARPMARLTPVPGLCDVVFIKVVGPITPVWWHDADASASRHEALAAASLASPRGTNRGWLTVHIQLVFWNDIHPARAGCPSVV